MKGLEKIAQIAIDDFAEQERAVSITPIELQNGEWSQFEILSQHPLALRNLKSHQLCWSYNATSSMAQQLLGDEVYVANPMLVKNEGAASTIIAWGAEVATACPLVDAIGIQEDRSFPQIMRKLEDVLEVCGPFAEMKQMQYPTRWLLPSRMSDEQRRILNENYPEYDFKFK